MDFLGFLGRSFIDKVPAVAGIIALLIVLSVIAGCFSFKDKRLNSFSQYAPTILTTAGLLGTFIGLTMGLKELKFSNGNLDVTSFAVLMENLKAVFVYALSGILFSLIFMVSNTGLLKRQNAQQQQNHEHIKQKAQQHNGALLELQESQKQHLMQISYLQKQQLESQKLAQADIAKLQFDNDNTQLAQLISQGVVQGLTPLLLEIKTAVADQGTEAIQRVLEDLKTEILVPMSHTLGRTNNALENTNQAVKETIEAINASQAHNEKLINAVSSAAEKMEIASGKMNGLVDKIDGTVQHMDEIQQEQNKTLTQFNTDLKENLDHIPVAIQTGMNAAQDSLVKAINETSLAMQRDVKQILVDTTSELKETIGEATTGMKDASIEMQKLVTSIDDTVQHMDHIQKEQKLSLDTFNKELKDNLATIKPAIVEGLDHAKNALTVAIGGAALAMSASIKQASEGMQDNIKVVSGEMVATIRSTLNDAGTELKGAVTQATTELNQSVEKTITKQNESIEASFSKFDEAQGKLNTILDTFSSDMNGHLDRMATELEAVGTNAEKVINSASHNLEKTLGDIDTKLLNTASVLKTSLVTFREQYQQSLTLYLNQQTENLNGFLDRQNEQLEQTIGQQRQGLEEVTHHLTEQFKFMDEKQREVNQATQGLITRIDAVQTTVLPQVQSIAFELRQGEKTLSQRLDQSAMHLNDISVALKDMGENLPQAFEDSFKLLDQKYQDSFKDLDHGLKGAVNNLGSTVAALAAAIPLHDAMTQ